MYETLILRQGKRGSGDERRRDEKKRGGQATDPSAILCNIQSIRMKDIKNEINISQKEFVIHINGLQKGNIKDFSAYIIFSINLNVGSLGDTTNI
jgi:hypothetical protein